MAHPPPYGQDPRYQGGPYGPPPPQGPGPYPPHHGPPHHGPPHQGPGQYPPHGGGYRRRDGAGYVAGLIHLVTGIVVAIFLLHIMFVVFEANQDNGFVSGVYDIAKVLVLGLGDVFTPDDAKLGVFLNYGFASLIYLAIGQVIARAVNRS
jgi:hypothetical protein